MRDLTRVFVCFSLLTISSIAAAWPPPENQQLSFEVYSGDLLIAGWTLAPDGNGEYWEPSAGDTSGPFARRKVVAKKDGYRFISTLVKPSYLFVENRVKCGEHISGKPRGTITWANAKGEKSVGAFDMGCQMEGSKTLIAALSKATQQMRAWSHQQKPSQ